MSSKRKRNDTSMNDLCKLVYELSVNKYANNRYKTARYQKIERELGKEYGNLAKMVFNFEKNCSSTSKQSILKKPGIAKKRKIEEIQKMLRETKI